MASAANGVRLMAILKSVKDSFNISLCFALQSDSEKLLVDPFPSIISGALCMSEVWQYKAIEIPRMN